MSGNAPATPVHVLVVTSDTSYADTIRSHLGDESEFRLTISDTVIGGLEKLSASDDIDCILGDSELPDFDGLTLLETVRAQHPDLPVVLVSPEKGQIDEERANQANVTDILSSADIRGMGNRLGDLLKGAVSYHRTRSSMRDRHARIEDILDSLQRGVAIVQDGTIVYANRLAVDIFGDDGSLLDRPLTEIISADDQTVSGGQFQTPSNSRIERIEIQPRARETPLEIAIASIEWQGKTAQLLMTRNISAQEPSAGALEQQNIRDGPLFETIRDAIVVADTDRKIIDCNPGFCDLFGYELDEIEGKTTEILYENEADFEALGEAIDLHADDEQFYYTVDCVKKSGDVFPGEMNIFYLRNDEEEVLGYIGLIRDISDQEYRLDKFKVIDRVLRHNLRNVMNVIEGNADWIRESADGQEAEKAETIINTSEGLLDTMQKERQITELLVEQPHSETISLASMVRVIVEEMGDTHPEADISVTAPDECKVRAPREIFRAIEEVIENAIVHVDRDYPEVDVEISENNGTVAISVADEGPGIPKMERKVLTGEQEKQPLYQGSGLGLWFVNLVVHRSDGKLEFSKNEPRGSVVTIKLTAAE